MRLERQPARVDPGIAVVVVGRCCVPGCPRDALIFCSRHDPARHSRFAFVAAKVRASMKRDVSKIEPAPPAPVHVAAVFSGDGCSWKRGDGLSPLSARYVRSRE